MWSSHMSCYFCTAEEFEYVFEMHMFANTHHNNHILMVTNACHYGKFHYHYASKKDTSYSDAATLPLQRQWYIIKS